MELSQLIDNLLLILKDKNIKQDDRSDAIYVGEREIDEDERIGILNDWVAYWESKYPRDISIIKTRGFTLQEYRTLFVGSIDEKDYLSHPAYQYNRIVSRQAREWFCMSHEPTVQGYLKIASTFQYVGQLFFSKEIQSYIPLKEMESHTYITAKTGHGKTEFMRLMFVDLMMRSANREFTLILLDPHDSFARKLSKLKIMKDNDRVVYINPALKDGYTARINPFDVVINSEIEKQRHIDNFIEAMVAVMGNTTEEISINMHSVLSLCLPFIFSRDGSTVKDLINLLSLRDPIITEARETNTEFAQEYFKASSTTQGISARLNKIIGNYVGKNMLGGKSTIDFKHLIESGSVIIFDLDALQGPTLDAIGRFIISTVKSIVNSRPGGNAKPVYFFIDEFPYFIGDDIEFMLTKLRHYGLRLILANQHLYQLGNKVHVVKGNTNVKIIGDSEPEMAKSFAESLRVNFDDILDLPRLEFLVKSGNRKSVRIKIPTHLFDTPGNKLYMSKQEYEEFLEDQVLKYYVPVNVEEMPTAPVKKKEVKREEGLSFTTKREF